MADMANQAGAGAQGAARELRDKVGQVGQSVRDLASTAGQAAREQLGAARETAMDYYERGVDRAHSMEQQLEEYIRERPLQSALVAAGLGLAIGLLFFRR